MHRTDVELGEVGAMMSHLSPIVFVLLFFLDFGLASSECLCRDGRVFRTWQLLEKHGSSNFRARVGNLVASVGVDGEARCELELYVYEITFLRDRRQVAQADLSTGRGSYIPPIPEGNGIYVIPSKDSTSCSSTDWTPFERRQIRAVPIKSPLDSETITGITLADPEESSSDKLGPNPSELAKMAHLVERDAFPYPHDLVAIGKQIEFKVSGTKRRVVHPGTLGRVVSDLVPDAVRV